MQTTVLVTKKQTYLVNQNEDGSLLITTGTGKPSINNAGALINNYGGVSGVMKCLRTIDCLFEDYVISAEEAKAEKSRIDPIIAAERRAINERMQAEKTESRKALISSEYNALLEQNKVIEATAANIRTVLRYLNTSNWGSWELPALTIGYTANQYDCDGVAATTITLDKPISDEACGFENKTMFKTGGKRGHLSKFITL